jgi:hypothetical protein
MALSTVDYHPDNATVYDFEVKLRQDLAKSAELLSKDQARYLVHLYYHLQHGRIATGGIIRASGDAPVELIEWFEGRYGRLESNLKNVLGRFAAAHGSGRWAQSVVGIGPVISAGLVAHIDPTQARYAGQVWRFAGLDPSQRWIGKDEARSLVGDRWDSDLTPTENAIQMAALVNRRAETVLKLATKGGERAVTRDNLAQAISLRPWNAELKVLAWKIGESFVKVVGRDDAFYGKVYANYKAKELARNERGELATQAADKLARFRIGKGTEAYKWYSQGKLPPAHIHARAKRAAVKLFLSHFHAVAYECEFGEPPAPPYAIEHLAGHHDFIPVPGWSGVAGETT